MLKIKMEHN